MRIIGGKHKGRILKEFDGQEIRPTSDRAREALFNIFAIKIIDSVFYDMFAGTGAVGIEAISRGAKQVVFTDVSRQSVEIIQKNLTMINEGATVVLKDGLEYLKTTNKRFDFIFIDPPYKSDCGINALKLIDDLDKLNPEGIAVFESDRVFDDQFVNLEKLSTRKYGKNCFNIYKRK